VLGEIFAPHLVLVGLPCIYMKVCLHVFFTPPFFLCRGLIMSNRHFLKEDLPRIRFANPNLDIQVQQAKKTAEEKWRPEIELELGAFVLSLTCLSLSDHICTPTQRTAKYKPWICKTNGQRRF
jgi:hypothetical protein